MTSAKSSGGKTNELLCNKPPCNVLDSAITLQYICCAIQCMRAAVCDIFLHYTPVHLVESVKVKTCA